MNIVRERDISGLPKTTRFAPHIRQEPDYVPLADERFANAVNMLSRISGRKGTVQTRTLDNFPDLNVHWSTPIELKDDRFTYSGSRVTLNLTDPVFVRQTVFYPKTVEQYLEVLKLGNVMHPIQVTDIVPGGGVWHLNGLHRLIAARLFGDTLEAHIWQ